MNKRDEIQEKAVEIAIKNKRVGLELSMGLGKTLIGLKYINAFIHAIPNLKVIIVCSKPLKVNWLQEIKKFNYDFLIPFIHFSTYQSVSKEISTYDICILDECHRIKEHHIPFLNTCGRILGLSGTMPVEKSLSVSYKIMNTFFPIKLSYKVDDAVSDKIINDYKITVYKIPLDKTKNIKVKTRNKSFQTSEYLNYHYLTKNIEEAPNIKNKKWASLMRMKALQAYKSKERFIQALLHSGRLNQKTLIYATSIEQAERLCSFSCHSKLDWKKNLEEFNKGTQNKMSCVQQLDEGTNIPNLKYIVVLHSYGNERRLAQKIGRSLRLNPDDTSEIIVACYKDTIDEIWVKDALVNFDSKKITYIECS